RARGLSQAQVARACGDAGTRLPGNLTARACRGVSSVRAVPTPPRPPVPPVPPRSRNIVVASSGR
ncbi:MAG: pentapeptide repeat-containing protein, partial [Brevundimonas sp.]|nr:pentapeptide repeat-containing protein [Brevundimonas sp.]